MNYFDFVVRFFKLEREVGELETKVATQRDEIKDLKNEISDIQGQLLILNKKREPQLILTTKLFNNQIKILAMNLQAQDFVDDILALEDSDTHTPIDATFANIVLTSSDPTIFTATTDVNADGTLDIVGVAPGDATLTVTADATYTDKNTQQSVTANKTATVPVTVTAPPPTAENTDLVVTFGTPQPVPTA